MSNAFARKVRTEYAAIHPVVCPHCESTEWKWWTKGAYWDYYADGCPLWQGWPIYLRNGRNSTQDFWVCTHCYAVIT